MKSELDVSMNKLEDAVNLRLQELTIAYANLDIAKKTFELIAEKSQETVIVELSQAALEEIK